MIDITVDRWRSTAPIPVPVENSENYNGGKMNSKVKAG